MGIRVNLYLSLVDLLDVGCCSKNDFVIFASTIQNMIMRMIFFFLSFVGLFGSISAQDVPKITNKLYVKNAFIVTRAGTTPVLSSVLITDGIITTIGAFTPIPYDAKVIDADSMYVYPGFIAGLSQVGIETPKEDPTVRPTSVGYPENSIAGITPERSASSLYKKDQSSISSFRESGYTVAHIVPEGNMLPGMGSIISLSGADFDRVAVSRDMSVYFQLKGSGRMFPGTIIGVMTKWKEMYKQAELDLAHQQAFAVNPRGKTHPQSDVAIQALFPVVQRQKPVFFRADDKLTLHRGLQLQKDLGYNVVLAETNSMAGAEEKLRLSKAQVLVSLKLPEAMKEEKDSTKIKADKMSDEMKALTQRKKDAILSYEGYAASLASAGVPFGFSLLQVKPKDVLTNIRRMIKAGLSEDAALAALTENPAKILGIERMAGTIENGKVGNLVITTAPLFDEKSKIKMVIVDGTVHEYDVKEKKSANNDGKSADLSGTWDYTIEVPGMTPTGTLIVTKQDDSYKIVITSNQAPGEEVEATQVDVEGNNVVFIWSVNTQGMNLTLSSDVDVDGESFSGKVGVGDFGSFPIKGSRISKPN